MQGISRVKSRISDDAPGIIQVSQGTCPARRSIYSACTDSCRGRCEEMPDVSIVYDGKHFSKDLCQIRRIL